MKNNQKGFIPLLVALVVVILAVAGYLMFVQKENLFKNLDQQTSQNIGQINNNSDLDAVSKDLDSTDMSQLDSQLNQVSSDAASF